MSDTIPRRSGSGPLFGMRGTGSWTEAEQPDSYHEGILRLYPNGSAPLTAMLAKLRKKKLDNPYFHWFTKGLPSKACDIPTAGTASAKVLTNTGRGTAYSAGTAVKYDELVVNLTAALVPSVLPGQLGLLRVSNNHAGDVTVKVLEVTRGGTDATCYARVELLQDDHGASAAGAKDADRFLIIGNAHPEGGTRPTSTATNPAEFTNYPQIFRNAYAITRTQIQTNTSRIGDMRAELKRETMEQHSIEMEDAFIWGRKSVRVGPNGQPERTTGGFIEFMEDSNPDGIIDAARQAAYSGKLFHEFGRDLLNACVKQTFDYGTSMDRLVLCGNGAMQAVQNIVTDNSQYEIYRGEAGYGIQVRSVETVFGTWHFKTHPRFTVEPSNSNMMMVLDPADLQFNYIQDTKFCADDRMGKGGGTGLDGIEEEFITEAGLEFHHPLKCLYVYNFGLDSLI